MGHQPKYNLGGGIGQQGTDSRRGEEHTLQGLGKVKEEEEISKLSCKIIKAKKTF